MNECGMVFENAPFLIINLGYLMLRDIYTISSTENAKTTKCHVESMCLGPEFQNMTSFQLGELNDSGSLRDHDSSSITPSLRRVISQQLLKDFAKMRMKQELWGNRECLIDIVSLKYNRDTE